MRRRTWLSAGLPVALSFAFALMVVLAPSRLHAQERRVFNPPGSPTNLPFSNGIQVGDMLWVAGTEGVVNGDIDVRDANRTRKREEGTQCGRLHTERGGAGDGLPRRRQ